MENFTALNTYPRKQPFNAQYKDLDVIRTNETGLKTFCRVPGFPEENITNNPLRCFQQNDTVHQACWALTAGRNWHPRAGVVTSVLKQLRAAEN